MRNLRRSVVGGIESVPFGADMLVHANWIRKDLRSVWSGRKDWVQLESQWPHNLNIGITNICNADCIFCAYQYQSRWQPERGVMAEDLFCRAVDTHAQNGGCVVGFSPVVGEPLLDPNILSRIEYAISKGLEVWFFTNGLLLHRIDLERLLRTGIKGINLSTAPFDREIYSRMYRSRRYTQLLEGVRRLLELRNRLKVDFTLTICFRSPYSPRETLATPDFRERIRPLMTSSEWEAVNVINRFDDWAGQIQQADLLPGMRLHLAPQIHRRPCKLMFGPYVSWNGKVRACGCRFRPREDGIDELEVGDMKTASLTDIWSGEAVRALRRRFPAGTLPDVCRRCPIYEPC